jgi:cell division protein FtsI/penicillin-binding protein 2
MQETQSTKRLLWLLRLLILWVVVIFLRLVWLQVLEHDDVDPSSIARGSRWRRAFPRSRFL